MFQRDITPTFSDIWHRVAESRPRLSPHVHVVRQRFGRGIAYVLEEPAGGTYHRLSESAYRFAGLLDGRRTVDDAWDACAVQLGDEAPTQKECVDLLSQLDTSGLLIGDVPVWSDMLEHRQSRVRQNRRRKRLGNGLFACVPLVNPDRWLELTRHLYQWLFSWKGALLWTVIATFAAWSLLSNLGRFAREMRLEVMLSPTNLAVAGVVFLLLRVIHELGHAMACKAMGGRCTEIGLMLVALVLPLPYCDATSSWRFSETWRRVLVAASGVIFESFFAAIAAILWARSEPGALSSVCYNVMFVSGVATFLFNLNPLLRYDGYYILSDVTGIPNLAQRATEMWKYLLVRFAFGVRSLRAPQVSDRREAILVMLFASLSLPYRLIVAGSICLAVSARYSSLGLVLAVACASVMLVWPLLKGIGYLLWSPVLLGRRSRAVGVVGLVLLILAVGLGAVPVRDRIYAPGWVRAESSIGVRPLESGYVIEVLAEPGQVVEVGDPLIRLENPDLVEALGIAAARLEQARVSRDEAELKSPAESRVADAKVRYAEEAYEKAASRAASLLVVASGRGRLVASGASVSDWRNLAGSYVSKGTMLGHISTVDTLRVRALVDDREIGHAFAHESDVQASVRIRGMASAALPAAITRVAAAGSRELENPAVSTGAGGEIAAQQTGERSLAALTPQFEVDLKLESAPKGIMQGQRARIRFEFGRTPLAVQWSRRIGQFWMNRFGA